MSQTGFYSRHMLSTPLPKMSTRACDGFTSKYFLVLKLGCLVGERGMKKVLVSIDVCGLGCMESVCVLEGLDWVRWHLILTKGALD